MCNVYNTGRSGGCGYATPINTGGCGVFGFGQRLCRDCNGNIRVINDGNGCCNQRWHTCPCYCGCGCGNNTTDTNNGTDTGNANGNTNGRYACVTVCGVLANTPTTANATTGDDYYARQYALNRRNNHCGCRCGGWLTF